MAVVNYVDGVWTIGLMEAQTVKHTRVVTTYYDIGGVVSNWILLGTLI